MTINNSNHRVVVKIGTNVITRADGSLDITRLSALTDQVASAMKKGYEVIIVSSGAVACGRSIVGPGTAEELDDLDRRQLCSAVGQAKLIDLYYTLFREYGIAVGQVLTTKESLAGEKQMETQRNCMRVMLRSNIVPIINENDAISLTELMFTDNDELAGLVARMMGATKLLLLSNVDGIYATNPDGSLNTSKVVREVGASKEVEQFILTQKSARGRGGMVSKEAIAAAAAADGIDTYIANGTRANIICDILWGEREDVPSTHFITTK